MAGPGPAEIAEEAGSAGRGPGTPGGPRGDTTFFKASKEGTQAQWPRRC